jgi:hypothetical protein
MHIGLCYEELGNAPDRKAYENVVRDYADQADIVAELLIRLTTLAGATEGSGSSTLIVRKVLAGAPAGGVSSDGRFVSFCGGDGESDNLSIHVLATGRNRMLVDSILVNLELWVMENFLPK